VVVRFVMMTMLLVMMMSTLRGKRAAGGQAKYKCC
jgi:hypothetical protein